MCNKWNKCKVYFFFIFFIFFFLFHRPVEALLQQNTWGCIIWFRVHAGKFCHFVILSFRYCHFAILPFCYCHFTLSSLVYFHVFHFHVFFTLGNSNIRNIDDWFQFEFQQFAHLVASIASTASISSISSTASTASISSTLSISSTSSAIFQSNTYSTRNAFLLFGYIIYIVIQAFGILPGSLHVCSTPVAIVATCCAGLLLSPGDKPEQNFVCSRRQGWNRKECMKTNCMIAKCSWPIVGYYFFFFYTWRFTVIYSA